MINDGKAFFEKSNKKTTTLVVCSILVPVKYGVIYE